MGNLFQSRTIFLILINLLYTLDTGAASASSVCEDVVKLSCAQNTREDGTGGAKYLPYANNDYLKVLAEAMQTVSLDGATQSKIFSALAVQNPQISCTSTSSGKECGAILCRALAAYYTCTVEENCEVYVRSFGLNEGIKNLLEPMKNTLMTKVQRWMETRPTPNPIAAQHIKTKTFPGVKSLIIEQIQKMQMPDNQKKVLIKRIEAVKLASFRCKESYYNFIPYAYMSPDTQEVHYCESNFRQVFSDFSAAFVIAHEISHFIDYCAIYDKELGPALPFSAQKNKESLDKAHPFAFVVQCLRGGSSAGAAYARPAKGKSCDRDDQMNEVLPDWFAAEVLEKYIQKEYPKLTQKQWQNGIANINTPFCPVKKTEGPLAVPQYPVSNKRINQVLLAQPALRKKMGCPEKAKQANYCGFKKQSSSEKQTPITHSTGGDQ